MYHFKYVSRNQIATTKRQVIELIGLVQREIRKQFTFQYEFIGSVKRNMVTCDVQSNIGFDFDVNIMVNDDDEEYSAKEIKYILMNAFNKFARRYRYDFCEDSTRVFTIKAKDKNNSRILYSCDFAIVNNYGDGRQEYIRFNKKAKIYTWVEQPDGFYCLPEKIEFCKEKHLWQEVRDVYINRKNFNTDKYKKSRSIFAEAVHQVCQQNGYYRSSTDKEIQKVFCIPLRQLQPRWADKGWEALS